MFVPIFFSSGLLFHFFVIWNAVCACVLAALFILQLFAIPSSLFHIQSEDTFACTVYIFRSPFKIRKTFYYSSFIRKYFIASGLNVCFYLSSAFVGIFFCCWKLSHICGRTKWSKQSCKFSMRSISEQEHGSFINLEFKKIPTNISQCKCIHLTWEYLKNPFTVCRAFDQSEREKHQLL